MFPDKTDTLYIEDRFHSGNTLRILSWFQTCARNSATTSQLTLTLRFFEPQPIYSNFSVTQRIFASLLFDTSWSTDKHGKIEGTVTKKDSWNPSMLFPELDLTRKRKVGKDDGNTLLETCCFGSRNRTFGIFVYKRVEDHVDRTFSWISSSRACSRAFRFACSRFSRPTR